MNTRTPLKTYRRTCRWCGHWFDADGKASATCFKCHSKRWVNGLRKRACGTPAVSLRFYLEKHKISKKEIKW